jgi:hypothetical protein
MPFTPYAVEAFISEKIGLVTTCGATDVSAEFPSSKDWVSGFGLMVVFANQPPEAMRPFVLQFIRRAEMAIAEYSMACCLLGDLVAGDRGRWSPYFRALYHFEASIAQLYQAYDYSRKLFQQNLFKCKDGSTFDRLNRINNTVKHEVARGEQTTWITNSGIEASDAVISFQELEVCFECVRRSQ